MVGKWSLPFWDVVFAWEDRVVAFTQSPKSWIKELCVYFRGVYSEEIRAVDGVNLVMHLDPEEFPTDVFWIVFLILWCWCWCIYHFITLWSLLTCCVFPSFFPIPVPTGQPFPSGFQAKSLLCWATMVPASPPPCRRFAVWQLQPKAGSMTSRFLGDKNSNEISWLKSMSTWHAETRPGDISVFGLNVPNDLVEVRKSMGFCPQHDVLFPASWHMGGHSPHQKHHQLHLKSYGLGYDSHSTCGALFISGGQVP